MSDPYGIHVGVASTLAYMLAGGGDEASKTSAAALLAMTLRVWAEKLGFHTTAQPMSFMMEESFQPTGIEANATGTAKTEPPEHEMPVSIHLCVWFMVLITIVCLVFEITHTQFFTKEWNEDKIKSRIVNANNDWHIWSNLKITRKYLNGEGKGRGRPMFVTILFLNIFHVGTTYATNVLVGRYWDAMQKQDYPKFQLALLAYCCMALIGILFVAYKSYIQGMLQIHFRETISRTYWKMWLADSAHYRSSYEGGALENPDQRIQADCNAYVSVAQGLIFGFFEKILTLVVFLPLLWHLSPEGPVEGMVWPGWLCQLSLVYAIVGSCLVHFVGKSMIDLEYGMERTQADWRKQMVTIRDESETVAMLGAEDREKDNLQELFNYVKGIYWRISFLNKRMAYFHGFFGMSADLGPLLLLAPSYFNGSISLGQLFQCRSALGIVREAMFWGISNYQSFAEWGVTCNRLDELENRCKEIPASAGIGREAGNLTCANLTYQLPDGKKLMENGNLNGEGWTLITGKEGSGKTTLLRVLRGIWPLEAGSVVKGDALFIPVTGKCAALRRGTLFEAVSYPNQTDQYTKAKAKEALQKVGLGHLDIEDVQEWGKRLSSGQSARLALAHVILEQPERLVLDEPTAHCAPGEPAELYKILKAECPGLKSVLTVTHQADDLAPFHDTQLILDPEARTLKDRATGAPVPIPEGIELPPLPEPPADEPPADGGAGVQV